MENTTPAEATAQPALSNEDLQELDELLDSLRERSEEVPQWEFCDGFLTAVVCTRRPISVGEWLPMLLGDGEDLQVPDGQPLPQLEVFASAEQQARFLELAQRRIDEIRTQLDTEVKSLADDEAFQPEVLDTRGAILVLPEAERAEIEDEEVPSFAQVWALGFMYAVETWPEEWQPPRDKEAAGWVEDAMQRIVAMTEDDEGEPTIRMFGDDSPPSVSQERLNAYGDAIWAVYDLRDTWKHVGPRVDTVRKAEEPGRNDPCSCGSGKKYKKCCGA